MHVVKPPDGLQFNHDQIFDDQIHALSCYLDFAVPDGYGLLTLVRKASAAQFEIQRLAVNGFQKARPERAMYLKCAFDRFRHHALGFRSKRSRQPHSIRFCVVPVVPVVVHGFLSVSSAYVRTLTSLPSLSIVIWPSKSVL